MAIRPVLVDKRSPFIGEACALCKEPFAPGDDLAICPEDATRHHVRCWRAYGDRCSAYGCTGHGEVIDSNEFGNARVRTVSRVEGREAKVQALPERSFHCAQSCLLIAIAFAILLFAIGCFGLWAIADYLMIDVLGWQYRDPIGGVIYLINPRIIALTLTSVSMTFFPARVPWTG